MLRVHIVNSEKSFASFDEAFTYMWQKVLRLTRRGTTWQVLETACWMSMDINESGHIGQLYMDFYQARDFGYRLGLLDRDRSRLKRSRPKIDPDLTICLFAGAEIERRPTLISSLLGDQSVYSPRRRTG